jgi:hypothetical protein
MGTRWAAGEAGAGRGSPPSRAPRPRAARGARRDQRGVGLVEMAIAAPLLILLVMGIIEFGAAYNDKIKLNQSVRDGARAGTVGEYPAACGSGNFPTRVICTTRRATGLADPSSVSVNVVSSGTAPGSNLLVCATATIDSNTPIIAQFLDGRTLKSKVTMRIERKDLVPAPSSGSSGGGDFSGWCAS